MKTILMRHKAYWRRCVYALLRERYREEQLSISEEEIVVQNSANYSFGDISFPLFPYAKIVSRSAKELGAQMCDTIQKEHSHRPWGRAEAVGGYLNIHLNRAAIIDGVCARASNDAITEEEVSAETPSPNDSLRGQKICVEYSSPNTNKPLHLGHLRNNVLGESIARILSYCGAEVVRINLINDRGIHICKSMAAYQKFARNAAPSDVNMKSDTFVGNYYVRFDKWHNDDPRAMAHAQDLLIKWESGDKETRRLWRAMRRWALDGIMETYRRTDIRFDVFQYESDTYLYGKEIVRNGVEQGVFRKADDGSIEIDLSDVGLDTKTVLRSDGTSIYITQDLGTAVQRDKKWRFDRVIYVVAQEQEYHFRVLFEIISRLRLPFAAQLFHCSYGIVELPDGKMKSREGTVVDADALIDTVRDAVRDEMDTNSTHLKDENIAQRSAIAERIAISSIHYWLLRVDPRKSITFDTKKSISFNGNSGAYILYMITRIHHLIAKMEEGDPSLYSRDLSCGRLLTHDIEWNMVFLLAQFDEIVMEAAKCYSPFPISQYLYKLAQLFSRYYHDVPIATERDLGIRHARMRLIRRLHATFERCCSFLVMPTVTNM